MADRPILFSAPMVRALLDGRKTQSRRIFPVDRLQPSKWTHDTIDCIGFVPTQGWRARSLNFNVWSKPFQLRFAKGDRLWVREAVWLPEGADDPHGHVTYRADHGDDPVLKWRPGIHMPRWASRLTLAASDVRVERLQAISAADCSAEGVCGLDADINNAQRAYRDIWEEINGLNSWLLNPWVIAVTFKPEHRNIDAQVSTAA